MPATPSSDLQDVLIVGAGIAGLTAARALRADGHRVLVLEKSRGLGGRAATRRWNGWPVDHGAQFFTARSAAFRAQVDDWLQRGICFEWSRGLHQASDEGPQPPDGDSYPRYACHEGMNSLGRDLAGPDASFVLRESKVVSVHREAETWAAETEDGRTYRGRALVMTSPPPQSAQLLETAAPEAARVLSKIAMAPCLALAASYPHRNFPWRGIQAPADPVVSWIGHDTSKRPDLHADATILVAHAAPKFSEEHFSDAQEAVAKTLLEAASRVAGVNLSHPDDYFLQRWRYALGPEGNGQAALLFSDGPPLVLAGDAIAGGKIEGAWQSGREAARLLVGL